MHDIINNLQKVLFLLIVKVYLSTEWTDHLTVIYHDEYILFWFILGYISLVPARKPIMTHVCIPKNGTAIWLLTFQSISWISARLAFIVNCNISHYKKYIMAKKLGDPGNLEIPICIQYIHKHQRCLLVLTVWHIARFSLSLL